MTEASLNKVYEAIGGLTAEVKGLRRDVQEDRSTSATHRQGVREELANIVLRQTHLEADVATLKNKVDGMEEVTVQVRTLRNKAQGAGMMGRWLLSAGGWILGAAGWLYGAYLWFTGRPPP